MVLGALALSYVQQLVANNQPLPNKVYLLSPMLDATLTNPEITEDLSTKTVSSTRMAYNVYSMYGRKEKH